MLLHVLMLTTMGPILQVGAGKTYPAPCAALAAASNGDTVEIDAATYTGDVCPVSKNNLVIKGVGGRPVIAAGGMISGRKGIWVITGSNTTVENIEFRDAKVDPLDGANGAGIRQEGDGLIIRNWCSSRRASSTTTATATPATATPGSPTTCTSAT